MTSRSRRLVGSLLVAALLALGLIVWQRRRVPAGGHALRSPPAADHRPHAGDEPTVTPSAPAARSADARAASSAAHASDAYAGARPAQGDAATCTTTCTTNAADAPARDDRRWLYTRGEAPLGDPPGTLGRFSDDDEDALGTMNAAWKKLARSCYAQAAAAHAPRAPPRAVVALAVTVVGDVNVGGVVESAELLDGGASDGPLVACLRESLLSLPFPPPRGGDFARFEFYESFGEAGA